MIPAKQINRLEKSCLICKRPTNCRRYGVISCAACKMFFRRSVDEKLSYICENEKKCQVRSTASTKSFCRACRFEKCLEVGMTYATNTLAILETSNNKQEELTKLLKELAALDSSVYLKLLNFYTDDDPSLVDILEGTKVTLVQKQAGQSISPWQWSFFATHVFISCFMNLSFIKELQLSDKFELFRCCAMKTGFLRAAMRAFRQKKENMFTPDGQDVYPQELVSLLNVDPLIMKRICSLLVTRMRELNVINEEFVLIQLIFFCNPALSYLSESAQTELSTKQKMYTSALFQFCQIKYQHTAPSRLSDLLSLSHVISKFFEDLQYVVMVFQCTIPNFKIQKLAIETFQLPESSDEINVEVKHD